MIKYSDRNINQEERRKYILQDMNNKMNWLRDNTDLNVAVMLLQGSQIYAQDIYCDEYMSDIDVKCLVIPTLEDIVKGNKMVSETLIMEDNTHIDVKDIRLYIDLWSKANPSFLDMLCSDFIIVNNDEFYDILNMSDEILEMNKLGLYKAIYGCMLQKQKALCHPYPSIKDKIDKYGYDSKQLSHLIRYYYLLKDLTDGCSFKQAITMDTQYTFSACYRSHIFEVKVNNGFYLKEDAVYLADMYCERAKKIIDNLNKDEFEFNYETQDRLKNIIYDMIINQCKYEILKKDA